MCERTSRHERVRVQRLAVADGALGEQGRIDARLHGAAEEAEALDAAADDDERERGKRRAG